MTRHVSLAALAALLLAGGACASAGSGGSGGSFGSSPLTSEELRSLEDSYTNLYEVIQDHRAAWLDTRGQVSVQGNPDAELPVVFLEGTERGLPETLRSVSVTDVGRVEYLDPGEATARYGSSYPGGVIDVRLLPLD